MQEKIVSRGPIRPSIVSGVSSAPRIVEKTTDGQTYVSRTEDGRVFRDVHTALALKTYNETRDETGFSFNQYLSPEVLAYVRKVKRNR